MNPATPLLKKAAMAGKNSRFAVAQWLDSDQELFERWIEGKIHLESFEGGTVYQAFLDAFSYHHWHSPVSGHIVKAYTIEGAYYSATLAMEPAEALQRQSQTYLAHVAARALIFIEADNADIGTLCFAAVGMCEVSSCEIAVQTGQHVKKGDRLGMFHFGGSTYCLILQPGLHAEFDLHDRTPGPFAKNIRVNEKLATVTVKSPTEGH